MKETDLHAPVKFWLEQQGYRVHAEVKDCDIVALRDEELVIVELKTSANVTLLLQAADRQRISRSVYVAIPEQAHKHRQRLAIARLVKRLGIGLLLVRFAPIGDTIRKVHDPADPGVRINRRAHAAVLKEIAGRSASYNVGGSSRMTIMTAYREAAIVLACLLAELGPTAPRTLRAMGAGINAREILADNHYDWFVRVERGIYGLTPAGLEAARDNPEIRELSTQLLYSRRGS